MSIFENQSMTVHSVIAFSKIKRLLTDEDMLRSKWSTCKIHWADKQNFPTLAVKIHNPKTVVSKFVTAVSCSCLYPTTVRVGWSAFVVGLRIEIFQLHFFLRESYTEYLSHICCWSMRRNMTALAATFLHILPGLQPMVFLVSEQ